MDSDEDENSESNDGEESNSGQDLLNANPRGHYWQNENYWKLPENVRNAIDLANIKSKHTSFWYRLQTLNDKIFVFRSVFYGRMPSYQKAFYLKKQRELEEKLRLEKEKYEKEMREMSKGVKKKVKRGKTEQIQIDQQTTDFLKG